jgi:hypothetical protein
MTLDPEDLQVQSYSTNTADAGLPADGPFGECCTGCVSGCGDDPTAGGCESAGGTAY